MSLEMNDEDERTIRTADIWFKCDQISGQIFWKRSRLRAEIKLQRIPR